MDHKVEEGPQVIFVSGTGRSGTNITKKIFSVHPHVATLPFEYRYIIDPGGVIDFYNSFSAQWSPYYSDYKIKQLRRFLLALAQVDEGKHKRTLAAKELRAQGKNITLPSYAGWELNKWVPGYERFVDELIGSLTEFTYPAAWPGAEEGVEGHEMIFSSYKDKDHLKPHLQTFLNHCFKAICKEQGKGVFLEDNTWNILFAKDLMDLVPNSKLIHVVRDPRDVLASLKNQHWAPDDIGQLITWYMEIMETWWRQKALLPPGSFLEARFEDIVGSDNSAMARMADFVGLAITDSMKNLDLTLHHIGRHKNELTISDIKEVENKLAPYISAYGYS